MLQKDKRKKTKIIQNDEGEDVEVTDDEAVSWNLTLTLKELACTEVMPAVITSIIRKKS